MLEDIFKHYCYVWFKLVHERHGLLTSFAPRKYTIQGIRFRTVFSSFFKSMMTFNYEYNTHQKSFKNVCWIHIWSVLVSFPSRVNFPHLLSSRNNCFIKLRHKVQLRKHLFFIFIYLFFFLQFYLFIFGFAGSLLLLRFFSSCGE